jgi:type IV pilus assembly protein PilV
MSTIRRHRPPAPSLRSIRGAGMIEVLVSVLVLAIGLLGIAAMQATALRNSQSSLERSQGVVYAYTILDAMRANAAAARAGAYDMGLTCAVPADGAIVNNDRRVWIQNLQANLGPAACGGIACNAGMCTITVRWDDSRGTGGNALQTFTTTARI